MEKDVFRRRELKYLLTPAQRTGLEAILSQHMVPDVHGESTVCSVYYDTPDSRLIRRSMEKPMYKEKLRVRSYGQAALGSEVYLELKKKFDGVVYKRRICLTAKQAEDYMAGCAPLPQDCQIGREIRYFRDFYGSLIPAMYLCCDRTAYACPDDASLRVTFDRHIRWRTSDLSLTSPPGGELLLPEQSSILEIKADSAMPLWLAQALSELQIWKTSFSKYGAAYAAQYERKSAAKKGVNYA